MIVLQFKTKEITKRKVLSSILEKGILYIGHVMFFGLNEPLICINQTIMFKYM